MARLAQRDALSKEFMPEGLDDIHGNAFKIGREIWRRKTKGERPDPNNGYEHLNRNLWGGPEEEDTAEQILNWHNTNFEK